MAETIVKDPDVQSKFKIKVDGQELEVTQDELVGLAQQGKDYTKKSQALSIEKEAIKAETARLAGLQSILNEMEQNPVLKEAINKTWADVKSGKIAKSDNKDSNLKKIDKLIEEASDPAEREKLRDIRTIIKEEAPSTNTKSLEEMIVALREEVSALRNTQNIGQSERVENQIAELEKKFGTDLIGKYKADIKAMAVKYPNQSVSKILYHFADDSEIEAAIL